MKAVIMAGGFGKRIAKLFSDIPKPMIGVCGKPVLEYQITNLRRCGITEIIIVVHHMKDKIINYFGNGSSFGVSIEYFEEDKPLGTAGSLFKLKDKLSEDFLLINGDLIFDIDFNRIIKFHQEHNALATLFTHPNSHPYDSELVVCGENDIVLDWFKSDGHGIYRNRVNTGIYVISNKVLSIVHVKGKANLREDVLHHLLPTNKIYAYFSLEYVKDMGTDERYRQVCSDVEKGLVEARRADRKHKAVFLDRDGTINKYKGNVTSPRQLELMDDAATAIKGINCSGYLAIVITNQPLIAMGKLTYGVLDEIHAKLDTLLGEDGAYLDAIYLCPYYPDKCVSNEVESLKIKCECRKPGIGLLKRAAEDFNIDLSESFMVGDSHRDVYAGLDAGCKTAYLRCGEQCDIKEKVDEYDDLADFVKERIENINK